jgi:chemotaxis protein MotB
VKQNPASLADIGDEVARAMAPLVLKDEVIIRKHKNWLEVEIKNDVLFPSGSATLTPTATGIVKQLSKVLNGLPNPIFVEGHTDNVPISSSVFPSNWELSAARASAVIRLLAAGGVSPTQMTALGLGEYRPTQSNETAEGRTANRRVLLAILQPERVGQSLYSQPGDPLLATPKAPPPTP